MWREICNSKWRTAEVPMTAAVWGSYTFRCSATIGHDHGVAGGDGTGCFRKARQCAEVSAGLGADNFDAVG